ncbi:MAG: hypothetical protein Tsb005_18220 [Gammaproteobacteria bacterium]
MSRLTKNSNTNVFEELGFAPEQASNLQMRSRLADILIRYIKQKELTQIQAAKILGITQPRVSDLIRGKISLFTVDALINMLARIGFRVSCTIESTGQINHTKLPQNTDDKAGTNRNNKNKSIVNIQ